MLRGKTSAAFEFYLIKFFALTIVLPSRAYLSFVLLGFHWFRTIFFLPKKLSILSPLYAVARLTRDSNSSLPKEGSINISSYQEA